MDSTWGNLRAACARSPTDKKEVLEALSAFLTRGEEEVAAACHYVHSTGVLVGDGDGEPPPGALTWDKLLQRPDYDVVDDDPGYLERFGWTLESTVIGRTFLDTTTHEVWMAVAQESTVAGSRWLIKKLG